MQYLSKEDRKSMLLCTAADLALKSGLANMTVRKIAHAANISVGQIHHHFSSIHCLKAETFSYLMQNRMRLEQESIQNSVTYYEKLKLALGLIELDALQPYLKLWNEAAILIEHDTVLATAYNENMENWHQEIYDIICLGIQHQEFKKIENIKEFSWYLISLICGFEMLNDLALASLNPSVLKNLIDQQIQYSLI